jgi:hypothetical protein
MAEDYERLQRKIEDGLDAVRELKKLADEEKRKERPKLKLVREGLIGGTIWAGVEWLRDYKIGVALTATAVAVVGGIIAEQPHSPGADPPAQAITKPATPRTSAPPTRPPSVTPRRTSPPRTKRVVTTRPAEVAKPKPSQLQAAPNLGAVKPPQAVRPSKPSSPSLPAESPSLPVVVESTQTCTGIDLLGLCILG